MWGDATIPQEEEPVGQSYGEGYIELPGREAPYTQYPFALHRATLEGYNAQDNQPPIGLQNPPNFPVNGKWAARFLKAAAWRRVYVMEDQDLRRDLQTAFPGLVPTENSMTADLLSPLRDWGKSMGIKRYQGG
jgi:hypothetical protein